MVIFRSCCTCMSWCTSNLFNTWTWGSPVTCVSLDSEVPIAELAPEHFQCLYSFLQPFNGVCAAILTEYTFRLLSEWRFLPIHCSLSVLPHSYSTIQSSALTLAMPKAELKLQRTLSSSFVIFLRFPFITLGTKVIIHFYTWQTLSKAAMWGFSPWTFYDVIILYDRINVSHEVRNENEFI